MEEIHCIYLINVLRISLTYFSIIADQRKIIGINRWTYFEVSSHRPKYSR